MCFLNYSEGKNKFSNFPNSYSSIIFNSCGIFPFTWCPFNLLKSTYKSWITPGNKQWQILLSMNKFYTNHIICPRMMVSWQGYVWFFSLQSIIVYILELSNLNFLFHLFLIRVMLPIATFSLQYLYIFADFHVINLKYMLCCYR